MTAFIVIGLVGFFTYVAYKELKKVAESGHARRWGDPD